MRVADYSRYRRGQVWFLEEPAEETERKLAKGCHLEAKSRPWLIVSIDDANHHASILNVVPLSLSADTSKSYHVAFTNDFGKTNAICVEQITTKSMRDFNDRGTYKFTVTDEVMQEVAAALGNQLGISIAMPNLDSIVKVIEKIAQEKMKAQQTAYQDQLDDIILNVGIKLEEIFGVKNVELTPTPAATEFIEKVNSLTVPMPESKVSAPKVDKGVKKSPRQKKVSSKRNLWSDERKRTFLKDTESLSAEMMAKKYNIDKTSVPKYSSKFRKELSAVSFVEGSAT